MAKQSKYTFSIKYWADVTITAKNEAKARDILERALTLIEVSEDAIEGFNDELERQGAKSRLYNFDLTELDRKLV